MGPLKTSGEINLVSDLGCDPTGRVDCWPIWQTCADQLTSDQTTFQIPAGRFLLSRTPIMGHYAPRVRGAGANLTFLGGPSGSTFPALCYGVRQAEKNATITGAYRPQAAGVLDLTIPLKTQGYRTWGNTYVVVVGHPAQIGMRSALTDDVRYDAWNEMPGFTLETAFSLNGTAPGGSFTIAGTDGVWRLIGAADNSNRLGFLFWTKSRPGDPWLVYIPLPNPVSSLVRLMVAIDWKSADVKAWVNGQPAVLSWSRGSPPLGDSFRPNHTSGAFYLGTDGDSAGITPFSVPDLTIWGLRVSRIARLPEGTDYLSYLAWLPNGSYDPDVIFFLPGTGPPGRTLDIRGGHAADMQWGVGWILPSTGWSGGVSGGAVEGVTLVNGPLLLGPLLNFRASDLRSAGVSPTGLQSLLPVASYTVDVRDSVFSGTDAGVHLKGCVARFSNINIDRGGDVSARFEECDLDWTGGFFNEFSSTQRAAVEFLPGAYGGTHTLRNLVVDSEASSFGQAAVIEAIEPYTTCTLRIEDLFVANVGANAVMIDLVGHELTEGAFNPATAYLSGLTTYSKTSQAAIRAGTGWQGTADLSTLPKENQQLIGPAADRFAVTTSPLSPGTTP